MIKAVVAALAVVAFSAAAAQPAPTLRIAGTIERASQDNVVIRPLEGGGTFDVYLADKASIIDVRKGNLADIKPGVFVGVGAMPQPDGSQRAIQITVFDESQRGVGEGHRPWDREPNSTMTNGTVDPVVTSVDGPAFTVKYAGGEKKIVVPPDATILAYSIGDRSELKEGASVSIPRAKKKLNGTLEADRINVGQGGVMPR